MTGLNVFLYLAICLFIYLPTSLLFGIFIYHFIYLYIYLSLKLFILLFILTPTGSVRRGSSSGAGLRAREVGDRATPQDGGPRPREDRRAHGSFEGGAEPEEAREGGEDEVQDAGEFREGEMF